MVDLNEILVDWTTPAGTRGRSVLYANAAGGSVSSQRSALNTFLAAYIPYCANTVQYAIETTGRVLVAETGQVTGEWSEPTVRAGVGTQTAGPVPDVAQVLVRWRSGLFVNGRRLQGRTFLPGLSRGNVEGGNVAPGVVTAVNTAATAFANALVGFSVWGRPQPSRAGTFSSIVSGSCWTEMATQRRRRA